MDLFSTKEYQRAILSYDERQFPSSPVDSWMRFRYLGNQTDALSLHLGSPWIRTALYAGFPANTD
jgi:hypothetical protein